MTINSLRISLNEFGLENNGDSLATKGKVFWGLSI